jgi:Ca2+/Na+ antiporter
MPPLSDELASLLLLGGSGVASYAASRALVDALLPANDPAPGKRAGIHALMTAIVALAAVLHRPALLDVAASVPFSATIAALTLALGVVLFVAPPQKPNFRDSDHRTWAFVLPTGLLTLMIGFTGALSVHSGLILAAEGGAILLVCMGREGRKTLAGGSSLMSADPAFDSHPRFAIAQAILAFALAIIAGWGMAQGAAGLSAQSPLFRPGVAAVLVLGPAVVLPMIPPIATLAERGRRNEAISAIVAFALLNLCVVLPAIICVHHLVQTAIAATQPSAILELPFPILVWRLDTVLLSTVGLLLLPPAIGRWSLARGEGLALMAGYVVYLFLTLVISHG